MAAPFSEPVLRQAACRRVGRPARRARRPCDAPDPGRGPEHPDRSRSMPSGQARCPSPAPSASTPPGIAFGDLPRDRRRSRHPQPLRPSRRRDDRPALAPRPAAHRRAARQRQRSSGRRTPGRARRGPRLGRVGRSRLRRHRPSRAGLSLVGARHERPPHGAVVRLRADDAGMARSTMSATRDTATAASSPVSATASARRGSRSCRSAPTSRAGSCSPST